MAFHSFTVGKLEAGGASKEAVIGMVDMAVRGLGRRWVINSSRHRRVGLVEWRVAADVLALMDTFEKSCFGSFVWVAIGARAE